MLISPEVGVNEELRVDKLGMNSWTTSLVYVVVVELFFSGPTTSRYL